MDSLNSIDRFDEVLEKRVAAEALEKAASAKLKENITSRKAMEKELDELQKRVQELQTRINVVQSTEEKLKQAKLVAGQRVTEARQQETLVMKDIQATSAQAASSSAPPTADRAQDAQPPRSPAKQGSRPTLPTPPSSSRRRSHSIPESQTIPGNVVSRRGSSVRTPGRKPRKLSAVPSPLDSTPHRLLASSSNTSLKPLPNPRGSLSVPGAGPGRRASQSRRLSDGSGLWGQSETERHAAEEELKKKEALRSMYSTKSMKEAKEKERQRKLEEKRIADAKVKAEEDRLQAEKDAVTQAAKEVQEEEDRRLQEEEDIKAALEAEIARKKAEEERLKQEEEDARRREEERPKSIEELQALHRAEEQEMRRNSMIMKSRQKAIDAGEADPMPDEGPLEGDKDEYTEWKKKGGYAQELRDEAAQKEKSDLQDAIDKVNKGSSLRARMVAEAGENQRRGSIYDRERRIR